MSALRIAIVFVASLGFVASPTRADDGAQESPDERRVEVRVTFVSGDSVYLDRGAEDGIREGDGVTLIGLTGRRVEARIAAVSSSSSRATTLDGKGPPAAGSRGFLLLPANRGASAEPKAEEGPKRAVEHPDWTAPLSERDPAAPLLAPAFATRAHDRPATVRGRVRAQMLIDKDSSGDRDATFSLYRVGLDLYARNLFGRGGQIEFSGDTERRVSEIDGLDDRTEDDLRIDRLFYRWGLGFDAPLTVTVGRFVPRDTPELGIVDGMEASVSIGAYGRLTLNGGALPEPSADRHTFDDVSTTLAWRWRADDRELLTTVLAVQQTWHEGDRDRRLILTRADWTATDDVTLHASAWIDHYDGDERVKDEGFELTEARGSVVWTVNRDHGLRTSASYTRWPEMLRWEFDDVAARFLDDNKLVRADVGGWHRLHENVRVDERVGVWSDQDDDGVTGDLGLRFPDLIAQHNEPGIRGFRIDGANEDGVGVRLSDRHTFDDVSIALAWETSRHEYDLDGDTRTRHAVLATVDIHAAADWSLSVETDYRFGDDQDAVSLSLYVEHRF